jgi:FkbM family methyltransferase
MVARIGQIPDIEVCNLAISDRNGQTAFYLSANPERSSVFSAIGESTRTVIEVAACTLEQLLRQQGITTIDLLKVDIEGAEVMMFASMSTDVLRRVSQITIEFHDFCDYMTAEQVEAIRDRLRAEGFEEFCFNMDNTNWLFVRRNAPGMNLVRRWYVQNIVRPSRIMLHRFRARTGITAIGLSTD